MKTQKYIILAFEVAFLYLFFITITSRVQWEQFSFQSPYSYIIIAILVILFGAMFKTILSILRPSEGFISPKGLINVPGERLNVLFEQIQTINLASPVRESLTNEPQITDSVPIEVGLKNGKTVSALLQLKVEDKSLIEQIDEKDSLVITLLELSNIVRINPQVQIADPIKNLIHPNQ